MKGFILWFCLLSVVYCIELKCFDRSVILECDGEGVSAYTFSEHTNHDAIRVVIKGNVGGVINFKDMINVNTVEVSDVTVNCDIIIGNVRDIQLYASSDDPQTCPVSMKKYFLKMSW